MKFEGESAMCEGDVFLGWTMIVLAIGFVLSIFK